MAVQNGEFRIVAGSHGLSTGRGDRARGPTAFEKLTAPFADVVVACSVDPGVLITVCYPRVERPDRMPVIERVTS